MAGLFGFTTYFPETTYKPDEWMKAGQGYNVLRADHEPVYYETKAKFQELYQPIREVDMDKDLKQFPINNIGRTLDPTFGLNASYYNTLIGKENEKPYGTEIYRPQSYPNHYYNTQQYSPVFLALK